MKRILLTLFVLLGLLGGRAGASITTTSYNTADDVTVDNLESNRKVLTDAINSGDGGLLQTGTVTAAKLDANANPENRWNEAFSDFVYTGLTTPTSASLSSTTASGISYVNGTRVVKDPTANTYTASKWTFVDLSSNGTYTYQETAVDASEPSVATNSIRLSRISTDTTTVLEVRDDRVTSITVAIGSASSIADTDADTMIQTQESDDEDIIRFDLGDTTLGAAAEAMTLQAVDATYIKLEPGTDDNLDLGSASKEYRNAYIDGTAEVDTLNADASTLTTTDINGGSMDGVNIGTTTATGELIVNDASDDANGLGDQGTAGELLTSAGAGVNPTWTAFTEGMEFVSRTSWTDTTDSDDVVIVPDVRYLVVFTIKSNETSDSTLTLRFNDDDGSTYAGASGSTITTNTSIAIATIGTLNEKGWANGRFIMDTVWTDQMSVSGEVTYIDGSVHVEQNNILGWWDNSATVADFQILTSQNTTGEIILYKLNES